MNDDEWKQVIDRACLILQERRNRDECYIKAEQNLNHINIARFISSDIKLKEMFDSNQENQMVGQQDHND